MTRVFPGTVRSRPLNTLLSASEATALWRYTNVLLLLLGYYYYYYCVKTTAVDVCYVATCGAFL